MAKAQPVLVQMAASDQNQTVSVIVQKANQTTSAEEQVKALGGNVKQDLKIINAFSAEMTAGAAVEISRSADVRWVSLDAAVTSSACTACIDTTNLANAYIRTIRADQVWNKSPYLQGKAIGVAVVDSGVNPNGDLYTVMGLNRQVADVRFNSDYNQSTFDGYGHGTHVASIIGGDGSESGGKYIGVAPMVNIINVKVSNDDGSAMMKDIVAGLQWVLDHKDAYNIRVVNLSLNSSVAESYQTSPLDAAVEILWLNKIVVVVSAGNQGSGALYPPANDPFVITVGATDDKSTNNLSDDIMASFSAYGQTSDGFKKPDLVAPGTNIVARLVNQNMGLASAHPANKVGDQYFRISGTSVAAPMVSGAVAILLQDEPTLTPDQVKYRLTSTANKSWPGYNSTKSGAGYLDVYAAVQGNSTQNANVGIRPSNLLFTGSTPIVWSNVGWNSVGWNSVGWNSVGWNSVGWNSDYWAQ
jgi:serine protease AprX